MHHTAPGASMIQQHVCHNASLYQYVLNPGAYLT